MTKKISIIGSGAMGTALAKVLVDTGAKNIVIYGINSQELDDLSQGKNLRYFSKEINLPKFQTTTNLSKALDKTSYIVLAVPSKIIDTVFEDIKSNLKHEALIINASKGFYPQTELSLQEGLKRASQNNNYIRGVVSLLGPSHAEEIVKNAYTSVAAIEKDALNTVEVQQLFSNRYFRVYRQNDEIGAEVGGAYKNILAIASGILNGKKMGINTIAALLTRGLNEAQKLALILGAKSDTLLGLTGVGDLIVTALSPLSRNYNFGYDFAINSHNALQTTNTVEGLTALEAVLRIAKNRQIELPIAELLYQVIYHNLDITQAIEIAWKRPLKEE